MKIITCDVCKKEIGMTDKVVPIYKTDEILKDLCIDCTNKIKEVQEKKIVEIKTIIAG